MSAPLLLRPYGDRALLVELGEVSRVVAYADALRVAGPAEVGEVVPAAETVLVVAADRVSLEALRAVLSTLGAALEAGKAPTVEGGPEEPIEISVRYDGPDLADVARLTGLSETEVVRAHTGRPWRVAFGGFAPGFGYLVGGDPRLEVPRRDAARTKVPAGAVGLAGSYSGVYPRESPGGWQLIGTTDAALWDLDRDPPALLRPGGVVRFVDETGT